MFQQTQHSYIRYESPTRAVWTGYGAMAIVAAPLVRGVHRCVFVLRLHAAMSRVLVGATTQLGPFLRSEVTFASNGGSVAFEGNGRVVCSSHTCAQSMPWLLRHTRTGTRTRTGTELLVALEADLRAPRGRRRRLSLIVHNTRWPCYITSPALSTSAFDYHYSFVIIVSSILVCAVSSLSLSLSLSILFLSSLLSYVLFSLHIVMCICVFSYSSYQSIYI